MQEAERAGSILITLNPNFHLSKKQQGVCIKYWTLQPPMSVQELSINLPKNPWLRGMSHDHNTSHMQATALWQQTFSEVTELYPKNLTLTIQALPHHHCNHPANNVHGDLYPRCLLGSDTS